MYIFLKIVHIASFTSWMAGLFYLPRLFVYHAERGASSPAVSETLGTMERKLYQFIMYPAMLSTWITGLALFVLGNYFEGTLYWIYGKIVLVVMLTYYHLLCQRWMLILSRKPDAYSGRFFRIANEVPTVIFIVIVILVVAQPF